MKPSIENSKGIILIVFSLEDCHGCKALKPTIDNLKIKYHNKVEFHDILAIEKGKLDPIAEQLHIIAAPTVVIYKDGEVMFQKTNPTKDDLTEQLDKLIGE
jgi:thioredoxin-like negative regulator of GroEL